MINFLFGANGNLIILGVPTIKHINMGRNSNLGPVVQN